MTLRQAVAQGGAITILLTLAASAQQGKIQDRIPVSPDALDWNSEGHSITGGPSSDEKYRRFREAADRLHREVEEMKRLEAEGKLQKPYRGLVSPDGNTCRPKKRLSIPPVLS
jgi:hypothetical protein